MGISMEREERKSPLPPLEALKVGEVGMACFWIFRRLSGMSRQVWDLPVQIQRLQGRVSLHRSFAFLQLVQACLLRFFFLAWFWKAE